MFVFAHYKDRARSLADDALGYAAEKRAVHAGVAVRRNHDQIDFQGASRFGDFAMRASLSNEGRIYEIANDAGFSNELGEFGAADLFDFIVVQEQLKHANHFREFDNEERGDFCAELFRQGGSIGERFRATV